MSVLLTSPKISHEHQRMFQEDGSIPRATTAAIGSARDLAASIGLSRRDLGVQGVNLFCSGRPIGIITSNCPGSNVQSPQPSLARCSDMFDPRIGLQAARVASKGAGHEFVFAHVAMTRAAIFFLASLS